MPRVVNKPEGSNWGQWGEDDEHGRMNLLTPDVVKRAAQEIQEGESFCLSKPLDMNALEAVMQQHGVKAKAGIS